MTTFDQLTPGDFIFSPEEGYYYYIVEKFPDHIILIKRLFNELNTNSRYWSVLSITKNKWNDSDLMFTNSYKEKFEYYSHNSLAVKLEQQQFLKTLFSTKWNVETI
jgi:hypothetical protein